MPHFNQYIPRFKSDECHFRINMEKKNDILRYLSLKYPTGLHWINRLHWSEDPSAVYCDKRFSERRNFSR